MASSFGRTSTRPGETSVFFYRDGQDTLYQCSLKIPLEQVTLADFKQTIQQAHTYRYYLKSLDPELGPIRKSIQDEACRLEPCQGKVVVWLERDLDQQAAAGLTETSRARSEYGSHDSDSSRSCKALIPLKSRKTVVASLRNAKDFTHRDHTFSSQARRLDYSIPGGVIEQTNRGFETDSMISSHCPSQKGSYSDSEFDGSSRVSSTVVSGEGASLPRNDRFRRRKLTKQRNYLVRASSASSVTDTVYSAAPGHNLLIIRFHREQGGTLGIKPVAHNGHICVESILKGCIVDVDKRIQPGDVILQVNDQHLSGMSTEMATRILRDITQTAAHICLKIIKAPPTAYGQQHSSQASEFSLPYPQSQTYLPYNSSTTPQNGLNLPYPEDLVIPSRPINLETWVAHTEAMRSVASLAPTTLYGGDGFLQPRYGMDEQQLRDGSGRESLSVDYSDRLTVVRRMVAHNSGLEVKNRMWLKIEIKNAFMGKNLVRWLKENVAGINGVKDAKRYAMQLIKDGLIVPTMGTGEEFSEKAYYTFDMPILEEQDNYQVCGDSINLVNHEDMDDIPDSVSQVADTSQQRHFPDRYHSDSHVHGLSRSSHGSQSSTASGNSGSENRLRRTIYEETSLSQVNAAGGARGSVNMMPSNVLASRQSFKMAMGKY